MSGDKRSVSTDALETLGTIIDGKAGRDAIHVAVEPMQAAVDLKPGQDVGLVAGGLAGPIEGQNLGIVDPFLRNPVKKGQWFWLLVYPRQITSLRHVWTHPAFPEKLLIGGVRVAAKSSEDWLRDFCKHHDCPDYDTVMALIEGKLAPVEGYGSYSHEYSDEYLHFVGYDAHSSIPPVFWEHVENVLGRSVPYKPGYFSCSC